MTEDPAEVGDNWYGYCDKCPTVGSDPTGLAPYGSIPASDGEGGSLGGYAVAYNPDGSITVTAAYFDDTGTTPLPGVGLTIYWNWSTSTIIVPGSGGMVGAVSPTSAGSPAGALAGAGLYVLGQAIGGTPEMLASDAGGALTFAQLRVAAATVKSSAVERCTMGRAAQCWKLGYKLRMGIAGDALNVAGDAMERIGTVGLVYTAASAGWQVGTAIDNIHYADGQSFADYYANTIAGDFPSISNVSVLGH